MATFNIRLSEDLERQLSAEAALEKRTRSEIAREALERYLRARERERYLAAMAEEARALSGHDVLETSEAFAEADAEALDLGEA